MSDNHHRETCIPGVVLCEGIAIGNPFFLSFTEEKVPSFAIQQHEIDNEISRYRNAIYQSQQEILKLKQGMLLEQKTEAASLLDTYLELLSDPLITLQVEDLIESSMKNAEAAFQHIVNEYRLQFKEVKDPFFCERLKEVLDVCRRVMSHLEDKTNASPIIIPKNSLICASQIVVSDVAEIQEEYAAGFITEKNGITSHAAILTKAKGIPSISSIDFHLLSGHKGGEIIIDAFKGIVILHPTKKTLNEYKKLQKKWIKYRSSIEFCGKCDPITKDHIPINLEANIEIPDEISQMKNYNASGVGLFRSEYMLLARNYLPCEEEQYLCYKQLVEQIPDLPVVIRVFDIGGDKFLGINADVQREENPFLGCRGIRILLKYKFFFQEHLRAILKASSHGLVKILLPMISSLFELQEAKSMILDVKKQLKSEGWNIPEHIPVGCMVELPSAVMIIDELAKECDFLSIGTNDLVQYTLGVDRSNQHMNYLYQSTHPSIVRLLHMIIKGAKRCKTPVSICGEIATNPRIVALLIGLGIRNISVSSRYLPMIKRAICSINASHAQQVAQEILLCGTTEEIEQILQENFQFEYDAVLFDKQS